LGTGWQKEWIHGRTRVGVMMVEGLGTWWEKVWGHDGNGHGDVVGEGVWDTE